MFEGDEIYSPALLQASSVLGLELVHPNNSALVLLQNQLALNQQQQPILRQCLTQSTAHSPLSAPLGSGVPTGNPHLDLVLEKALLSHQLLQQKSCEDKNFYLTVQTQIRNQSSERSDLLHDANGLSPHPVVSWDDGVGQEGRSRSVSTLGYSEEQGPGFSQNQHHHHHHHRPCLDLKRRYSVSSMTKEKG